MHATEVIVSHNKLCFPGKLCLTVFGGGVDHNQRSACKCIMVGASYVLCPA